MQLDQAARDVEAEAGRVGPGRRVVLGGLRVQERIEDALAIFLGDADAVVAHAQARPAARDSARAAPRRRSIAISPLSGV